MNVDVKDYHFIKRDLLRSKHAPNLKNSCLVKILLDTYKESFDRYFSKTKKNANLTLTIDLIHMICKGVKYEGGEIEMTPQEFFKFFVKY